MSAWRLGDQGPHIYWLRRTLNGLVDAQLKASTEFDGDLEEAVLAFQDAHELLADGVVGRITCQSLGDAYKRQLVSSFGQEDGLVARATVSCGLPGDTAATCSLRADVARELQDVQQVLEEQGAALSCEEGFRPLSEPGSADHSALSMHYAGRAVSLATSQGMRDPRNDAYVVVAEADRLHRVFVRARDGESMKLKAVTYASRAGGAEVRGRFIDLTALMLEHGFERVRARPRFYHGPDSPQARHSAEWWHFQYQVGLLHEHTTFGSELQLVWPADELRQSKPWQYRDFVFGEGWS